MSTNVTQEIIARFMRNPSLPCPLQLKTKQISVKTINAVTQQSCVEINLTVQINDLTATHPFIITYAISSEQAILGIDFIRQHNIQRSH
jgi:hypothetical protein